jgi:hypothetical protein
MGRIFMVGLCVITMISCAPASDEQRLKSIEERLTALEQKVNSLETSEGKASPGREPTTTSATADKSSPLDPTNAEFNDADSVIVAHCKSKWATDFEMQAYCQKQQNEAVSKLKNRSTSNAPAEVFATVRKECSAKWAEDFEMRNYCEEQQLEGYDALKRK